MIWLTFRIRMPFEIGTVATLCPRGTRPPTKMPETPIARHQIIDGHHNVVIGMRPNDPSRRRARHSHQFSR